jgi:cardiolipin synthase
MAGVIDVNDVWSLRALADQAFSRAAGAALIPGNTIRLLKNAEENYPAWLDAIRSARRTIHFESYIIHDDEVGWAFARALMAKAREGVRVRVIYDWLGAFRKTSGRFWRELRTAGVDVRCFNPPRLDEPLGWLSRDHRKMITVDGRVGFVTGLCVGRMWMGDPERGVQAWRDTGVEVIGPAVADLERAFSRAWSACGSPLSPEEWSPEAQAPVPGGVALRIVASEPAVTGLYRLDQLIAAGARTSVWIADAYYAATPAYGQALRAAALDGVDVRLLVPGFSDIPVLRLLSAAGYRPLLDAGVRVYEWNGPMLHLKTAVADRLWSRVGSTNLNPVSWFTNWELDVTVEDEGFARKMEEAYLADLECATEVVLKDQKVYVTAHSGGGTDRGKIAGGSLGRATASALRLGSGVGAAIAHRRVLGPAEARIMVAAAVLLGVVSLVALFWPPLVAIPLGSIGAWISLSLLWKAYRVTRPRHEGSGRHE